MGNDPWRRLRRAFDKATTISAYNHLHPLTISLRFENERDQLDAANALNDFMEGSSPEHDPDRPFAEGFADALSVVASSPPIDQSGLREALEPFAQAIDDWGDEPENYPDKAEIWEGAVAMNITYGDLRRARAALASSQGEA